MLFCVLFVAVIQQHGATNILFTSKQWKRYIMLVYSSCDIEINHVTTSVNMIYCFQELTVLYYTNACCLCVYCATYMCTICISSCSQGTRGKTTAEGNHGTAEDGHCVVWKWMGHYPQVHMFIVLSASSSTQGSSFVDLVKDPLIIWLWQSETDYLSLLKLSSAVWNSLLHSHLECITYSALQIFCILLLYKMSVMSTSVHCCKFK